MIFSAPLRMRTWVWCGEPFVLGHGAWPPRPSCKGAPLPATFVGNLVLNHL